jgi:acyl-CoA thioesterase
MRPTGRSLNSTFVPTPPNPNPQATAEHVRSGMLVHDHATRSLGIQIESVAPGRCVASMAVRSDMLNGFHICHGGFVTTLADSAFAFACNAANEMTVAAGISIDILAASRLGDVLTARASERHQSGRLGVYDVEVTNQAGELVALFRGKSYRMKGRPAVPWPPTEEPAD